ncbi:protein of unknown function [Nocardia cyriacigeorgica GUH-2]|uniref:Uncharacterized protein n=1 Tax=Nocardia cyriacigeorgica (strain GUH-2) TaxID=1127134 RepID=H6R438_NOCCG|nr:protein of unknown function [Nocardia cyriacigeorgica GUH-2]
MCRYRGSSTIFSTHNSHGGIHIFVI